MAKTQVRAGVFETNSSSTHSLTVCTGDEFKMFTSGEAFWGKLDDAILSKDEVGEMYAKALADGRIDAYYTTDGEWYEDQIVRDQVISFYDLKTYDAWGEWLETFNHSFTSPSGDEMVAFGEYGHDG